MDRGGDLGNGRQKAFESAVGDLDAGLKNVFQLHFGLHFEP
jgi:hypothetical protein